MQPYELLYPEIDENWQTVVMIYYGFGIRHTNSIVKGSTGKIIRI